MILIPAQAKWNRRIKNSRLSIVSLWLAWASSDPVVLPTEEQVKGKNKGREKERREKDEALCITHNSTR